MDTIADMLTRIRNAQMAGNELVQMEASKLKLAIANILEKEGFVNSAVEENDGNKKILKITLKYHQPTRTKKYSAITGIKRISKEGQRIYKRKKDIKSIRNNFGIAIISTSKGVMTGEEAKKNGLGGEYICEVW